MLLNGSDAMNHGETRIKKVKMKGITGMLSDVDQKRGIKERNKPTKNTKVKHDIQFRNHES